MDSCGLVSSIRGASRSRRSPAPRFYPLTDPVVKFLQETLKENPQGRVACSDLRYILHTLVLHTYIHTFT